MPSIWLLDRRRHHRASPSLIPAANSTTGMRAGFSRRDPGGHAGDRRHRRPQRPVFLAGRNDALCGGGTRQAEQAGLGLQGERRRHAGRAQQAPSRPPPMARWMASNAMKAATCGAAGEAPAHPRRALKGWMGCAYSTQQARRSATFTCRSAALICASAARRAIACSWPAAPGIYALYVNARGATYT